MAATDSDSVSQLRTIRKRTEMSQRYYDTVTQMIRSQAYREMAAAVVFAEALGYVPTLEFKKQVVKHVEEELEHYEVCCQLYDELGAGDLDAICSRKLAGERPIPRIESFLELGMAQMLYDCASAFQLQEYENSSFDPYCRVIGKILEEEQGHEDFGAEIVIQHAGDPERRPQAQVIFNRWLAVSMQSFGRPQTEGNRYAVSVGLKTRDSCAVAQDYLDSLKSTMRVCGLVFPTREQLAAMGVETFHCVDLSL